MCTTILLFFFFFTEWPMVCFDKHQMEMEWEEDTGSVKISPFSIRGMLIQLLSLHSSKLFCFHCLSNNNKKTQHKNPCIPFLIGEL
jgi:hypothetical protein